MNYPTEDSIKKLIGLKVKRLRKERNISQADLCYEVDIDLSTLSRLERGELNVTLNTLYKICFFLNVPLKELFDFETLN